MDIAALSSSLAASYFPRAMAAEGATGRMRSASRDSTEVVKGQTTLQTTVSEAARNANSDAIRKETREAPEARQAGATSSAPSPRIQFTDAEGIRVMEVYDSKDVLIYQVPPKGALRLIQNQQSDSQVETSA